MKKYLNQTTVNIIALAGAVAWGVCLVGNVTKTLTSNETNANLVASRIDHEKQITMNKHLDHEIARLKNCGELKRYGIEFHPEAPSAWLCADVILTNTGE